METDSVGNELGIVPGDEILSADGFPFLDILDYEYFDACEKFTMTVKKPNGKKQEFTIEKGEEETLGLSFENDGLSVKQCKNKCLFCFVDQLPEIPDLRESLKIKDDDYRYSFLYGAYVTATNFNDADVSRVKRLRLSPLYFSVHSTNEAIRKQLLGIKNAPPVLPLIKELYEAGIVIHAQIVYCPGINEDIEQTARDLSPYCGSLAVVPVGQTKFRNPVLQSVSKADAHAVITVCERLQQEFIVSKSTRFIWCADEFYLRAEKEIPAFGFYENYPQLDNGVGLVAKFIEDLEYGINEAKEIYKRKPVPQKISVACGESAYCCIREASCRLEKQFGVHISVHKIVNSFFGTSVTVSGLLTGRDLADGLIGTDLGDQLLLPSVMFREGSEEFLDNMTISQLRAALGVEILKVPADGESFVYAVLGLSI